MIIQAYICSMDILLSIETSGPVCSIALSQGDTLLGLEEMEGERVHGEFIISLIQSLLNTANYRIEDVSGISVSSGPGSFTGLRVGMATAKGLCTALGIPLILVPTLEAIAHGMRQKNPDQAYYCALITARPGEAFAAVYDNSGQAVIPGFTWLWQTSEAWPFETTPGVITFGGPGVEAVRHLLEQHIVQAPIPLSAKWVCIPAQSHWKNKHFADIITAEPLYIKPVRITQSSKS